MKLSEQTQDLTTGNLWQKIWLFVLPIFLGTVFQSFYTIADAVIVGRFSGRDGLAALESVYFLTKLPVNFFTGVASGAAIIISQYFGAKKLDRISAASHTAVLFAFLGGALLSVATCLTAPFFIRLIEVPAEIEQAALTYVLIYFGGMAFSMLYNVVAGILRALGDSRTPFYFLILASVLNVGLDLLFVAVFDWGVTGAAVATLIAQIVCTALIMAFLMKTDLPCKLRLAELRFTGKYLRKIVRLGLPIGVQAIVYPLANIVIQSAINTFGVSSIAAWSVCGKLDFLIWALSDAFYLAISTFVAQNYGAGQYRRMRQGVRVALLMAAGFVLSISAILYFWHIPLGYALVNDAEVITIMSQIIHLFAPLYFLYIFGCVLPGAIQGTGETVTPMILTLIGTCASRILWIYLVLPRYRSFMTVMLCFPVSWALTAVILIVYYSRVVRRLTRA